MQLKSLVQGRARDCVCVWRLEEEQLLRSVEGQAASDEEEEKWSGEQQRQVGEVKRILSRLSCCGERYCSPPHHHRSSSSSSSHPSISLFLQQLRQQSFQKADVQLWEPAERGELQRRGGAPGEGDQAPEGAGAEGEPRRPGPGAGTAAGSRVGRCSALVALDDLLSGRSAAGSCLLNLL